MSGRVLGAIQMLKRRVHIHRERRRDQIREYERRQQLGQRSPKGVTRPPVITAQQVTPPPLVYTEDGGR